QVVALDCGRPGAGDVGGREPEVRIRDADFGMLSGYAAAGRATMNEDVAAMLLGRSENRRQRSCTGEADKRIERQRRAEQPELLMRPLQLFCRRCDGGGRQGRKS